MAHSDIDGEEEKLVAEVDGEGRRSLAQLDYSGKPTNTQKHTNSKNWLYYALTLSLETQEHIQLGLYSK